jgi:hypothetical protein
VSSLSSCRLPVVLLEPFELRDHDFARWERIPVFAWESARQENLDRSAIRGRRLVRVVGDGYDQIMDHVTKGSATLFRIADSVDEQWTFAATPR